MARMLAALFLIRDLTSKSFPLNRIANFFELNQIASSGCSNQIFAWSNQNAGSCYRVNRNLDLPISAIHRRTAGL